MCVDALDAVPDLRVAARVCGRVRLLCLSAKLLPERFPLSLLLGHELHKFWGLPDPIQKMVAGKERIVGKAGRGRLFQPLHCFTAVT